MTNTTTKSVGIAGTGALGSAVARTFINGINGYTLTCASDIKPNKNLNISYVSFTEMAQNCDLIIETLPPPIVPDLCEKVFKEDKDMIMLSACAILLFPEILERHKRVNSRILVPSGALAGIDGGTALAQMGIKNAHIASTKPPKGFSNAPYIIQNNINLNKIKEKTLLFSGNALDAAQGFPANVNVAATLSIAGIGAEKTIVEIWADPNAIGNCHEIKVEGEFSSITAKVENIPDPANPKSSMLAAQSIISLLKKLNEPLVVL